MIRSALKLISKTIFKLIGWRVDVTLPSVKKFVLIGAHHTSNWDFPLTILVFWTLKLKIHWVGKVQLFRGPLRYLFTALGGIPVDRSAANGFIEQIAERFNHSEEMILAIAPEGTRKKTDYWKTGFYYIALKANVPICLGYIDYANRTIGFAQMLVPSGDIEKDFEQIKLFYQDKTGKYPEKQSTIQIKNKHG